MPKRTSSLGVVSLILGALAFLICWIPFIGMLGLPLSGLGLLLAFIGIIVALTRHGSGIGWPIGGGVVSGLALLIAMGQVAVLRAGAYAILKSTEQTTRTNQQAVAPPPVKPEQVANDLKPEAAAAIHGETGQEAPKPDTGVPGRAADKTEWASAKGAVRQGDVEVRVTSVLVGKVPLRDRFNLGTGGGQGTSLDDLLAIHIELTNQSQSRKVEYRSWLGSDVSFSRDYATVGDNFGNTYKRISFGLGTDIIGHTESESIYPGKSLGDVLVFEVPVAAAEYLSLELPAKNFGGEGMLRLRIPGEMIKRR